MKNFKSFLTESSTKGSKGMEQVIVFCHNTFKTVKRFETFKRRVEEDESIMSFIKKGSGGIKIGRGERAIRRLYDFASMLNEQTYGVGSAEQLANYYSVSGFWEETTGKNIDLSKADIVIGNDSVSIKNESSQLMGANKRESKAVFLTALEMSGSYRTKLIKEIENNIDNFVEGIKSQGKKFNQKGLKNIDKKDIKQKKNIIAREQLDMAEKIKTKTMENMETLFNRNPDFKRYFVYEACSGLEKFSGKVMGQGSGYEQATANAFLVYTKDLSKVIYEPMNRKNSKVLKNIADRATLNLNLMSKTRYSKKGGRKRTLGYDINNAIRMDLKTQFDEALDNIEGDYLTEGNLRDIWDKLIDNLMNLVNRIKTMLKEGIDKILEYLGIDIEVETNLSKEIQLI